MLYILFWIVVQLLFFVVLLVLQFFFIVLVIAFSKGEYINSDYSIILCYSRSNISSSVKYLYLSILPNNNVDIFAASLLISYYKVSFLILSSMVRITFYTNWTSLVNYNVCLYPLVCVPIPTKKTKARKANALAGNNILKKV